VRSWSHDAQLREAVAAIRSQLATLLIAATTVTAGAILAIVALHMVTD
jgi:hypothetical protein